ncbi:hypothetical protein [Bergeyella cardium]|uniref:Uncharacterized protein n=1 Tax=Bergeyella cardium TaxID=1585976 RepID=A0A6P1QWJ6_9FLAO|nr:hypothetical protein [Bergeyella cardium]QHN65507.1 hypothetical protein DBX24_06215 [Bergeyella cardium]WHE33087.1 hypothetical protein P8603_06245 [Bergeyella cardium]WHF59737.1 hypothetical protein O0R51_06245 [Bergeyella cardium]
MNDIRDIRRTINQEIVKKIFGNKKNAIIFLSYFNYDGNMWSRKSSSEVYNEIVRIWNYDEAKDKLREIFKNTPKYLRGLEGENNINILISEWRNLGLGNISWPFSQGQFDNFVQSLNSENSDRNTKDEKVKEAAVKYRRIKEINTERNDFLETLIFQKNENIIPTISHSRGVDFFIDGISYDQKVAKSPTQEFKRDFNNWREIAINSPEKVAEYLYKYQDEGRFGASPRLFIVYLDENISPLRVRELIDRSSLDTPLQITFNYNHQNGGIRTYKTQAFIILLYNN